jgi:phospholipid/cholesterol/gamma-HCH transport system substrate-binding protein
MSQLEIKPTAGMRLRVFAIAGLALLLTAILVFLFIGRRGALFTATTDISTYLPDATGVSIGTPVRLSGIQIGTVTEIQLSKSLDPQRQVLVRMTVQTRYLKDIPINSTTAIGSLTLVGDKYIDINEGKSAASLPPNGILESEPVKQAADRADLMRALADELRQVNAVLVTMSDPNSPLGQFILGEAEYDAALQRVTQVDETIRGVVAPQSPVGQFLVSNKVYESIHRRVTSIDKQLQAIQNGEGTAGQLFLNEDRYRDLTGKMQAAHAEIANLNAGKGAAGELLTSDARYAAAEAALNKIDSMLASLESDRSEFARLTRDPQLYESLTGTLRDLADFLRDFRENPQKYMRYQVFGKKKIKSRH